MKNKEGRLLFIDIETGPNTGLFWRTGYKVNIDHKAILTERVILSVGWMYHTDKKASSLHFDIKKQCDKQMLIKVQKLLSQPNIIVIGQNHKRFDIPWINGRLAYHGLKPLPPVQYIDTMEMAKRSLGLNCYRLDYMLKFFGRKGKLHMEFDDWVKIIRDKCKVSLAKMVRYMKVDVQETKWLFFKILPYSTLDVHLGLFLGLKETVMRDDCPECGSNHKWKDGTKIGKTGLKHYRYWCQDCGRKWWDYCNTTARLIKGG